MNINHNKLSAKSQNKMILDALKAGDWLTQLDALNRFGCLRLGARIYDLRAMGYDKICSRTIKTSTGKRVTQYYYQH